RGEGLRVADGPALSRAAKTAAEELKAHGVTPAFLEAEWGMVVDAYGVASWEEYAAVDRAARGTPLNRAQRQTAWKGIEAMRALLNADGQTTWSTVCWDLVEHLDETSERPCAHVIADEVQDFGPAELRLLRALARSEEHTSELQSRENL